MSDEEESIATILRKFALTMSASFHSPVDYWLEMRPEEINDWMEAAALVEKERHG